MGDFKRERAREQIMRLGRHFVIFVCLLCIAVLLGRGVWRMYAKLSVATQGEEESRAQLASLQQQHETLAVSVEEVTSARGIEEQLRQRYGLAKPGEGEIHIVTLEPTTTLATTTPPSFFKRLWQMLRVW